MRIAHVSFSSGGGAGGVAESLVKEQNVLGHESLLFSLTRSAITLATAIRHPKPVGLSLFDNIVAKNSDFDAFFSLTRWDVTTLRTQRVREWEPDILHLHWLPGILSPEAALTLSSSLPSVVTLHDMAFFTGGCHYSLGCEGFTTGCRGCPAVRKFFHNRVSSNHERILALTHSAKAVTAPTDWLMSLYKSTNPPSGQLTRVIGNPAVTGATNQTPPNRTNENKFCIIASRLDDPIKRVDKAVRALLSRADCSEVILIGRGGSRIASIDTRVRYLGELSKSEIIEAIRTSTYIVSSSAQEAFGMTIIESASIGVPSIVLSGSGSEELAREGGHVLVKGFNDLVSTPLARPSSAEYRELSNTVKIHSMKFDSKRIAAKFVDLYESLMI